MVDDLALGVASAGAWARVSALATKAGEVVGAIGVLDALGAAGGVWVALVILDAAADGLGRALLLLLTDASI